MIFINLGLIIAFSFLLIKATDILIVNLKHLADATKLGDFFITSFILALATSLPELFVGISSAMEGTPALSLGNVIGSNIANLSLVIGGAAFLGGGLVVKGEFLTRDVFYAFLGGATPMILLYDRSLSRLDGLVLLSLYGFYNVSILRDGMQKMAEGRGKKGIWLKKILQRLNRGFAAEDLKEIGWIFFGAALLLFSANVLVKLATNLALSLNVPVLVIGLFVISIGTTLPELVFGIKAVKQRKPSMVFGNLMGSIVANGTLVIGLTTIISPFTVKAFGDYLLATLAYVLIFAIFYLFIRTKKCLERWEGVVLVSFFFLFAILELVT